MDTIMNMNIKNSKLYNLLRFRLKYKISTKNIILAKQAYEHKQFTILDWNESIERLKQERLSLARFGDGEFQCINGLMLNSKAGKNICNREVQIKLKDVLKSKNRKLLIGIIPSPLLPCGPFIKELNLHWNQYNYYIRYKNVFNLLSESKVYSDSTIFLKTTILDSAQLPKYETQIKSIWNNKEVCFVTSQKGRLDIDDPIFNNISSRHVIFIPEKNAFSSYPSIMNECKEFSKDVLFLLSAGFTATLLAHDLCEDGYQAIDIGHITHSRRNITV